MSIAYDFDPDVSPIHADDDDEQHSVHFSSADTPKKTGRLTQPTLGASRLFEEITEEFHDFHQECAPSENFEKTSEEVADSTTNRAENEEDDVENSDEVVPDSRNPSEDVKNASDEVVPDSTGFLEGTFIVLSAGCCLPIRHHLSKCLSEMGASVQKTVDTRTSHIVVDRYADEEMVRKAMLREPIPPMMVDVKWIQECQDQRQRCEETSFSMRGARYLRRTCKRLSSFREMTPLGAQMEETHWEDMEDEGPQDPTELLKQIRELSERLDALLDYAPIIRFEYHSPDCPTRARFSARPPERAAHFLDPLKIRQTMTMMSTSSGIRRRRSFTGFHLEHRRDDVENDDVFRIREEFSDERKTWSPPKKIGRKVTISGKNTAKTNQKTKKINKNAKKIDKTPKKVEKMKPVSVNDSDINGALASLTISGNSVEILEDVSRRRPLVVTKSAFINRLQIRENPENEDDDFISDVSAYRSKIDNSRREEKNQKTSKIQKTLTIREDVENEIQVERERNQVVFTGFSKGCSIEKKLKSIIRRFKLQISMEIDEKLTKCVISRHGKRTLMVLKALCIDIPIVKPQWLEESFEDSFLLPHDDYIFDEWRRIPRENSEIFTNFPKFWISVDCEDGLKREDLCWIVEKCGGEFTRKPRRAGIVIGPENWKIPDEIIKNSEKFDICTPLFIIDSVANGELQEPREYLVNT